jgi:hypothetical protein
MLVLSQLVLSLPALAQDDGCHVLSGHDFRALVKEAQGAIDWRLGLRLGAVFGQFRQGTVSELAIEQ